MTPKIIVSYDDTANDQDALALGRLLADAGADLALAYVRHARESDRARELAEEREAERLLERGARSIGVPDAARHVVLHASTADGLRELAEREHADVVVFGSDYRTAAGTVRPGTSAQRLLDGGPAGVAIAPADLRSRRSVSVGRIGVLADAGDTAADQTARSLADTLGADVVAAGAEPVDLLVVGSRAEAPVGRVTLSAAAEYEIETATCPVVVVPRGAALRFAAPALAAV